MRTNVVAKVRPSLGNHGFRMVVSESCGSWIRREGWLACGWVAVDSVHIGVGKWLNRRRSSECGRVRPWTRGVRREVRPICFA